MPILNDSNKKRLMDFIEKNKHSYPQGIQEFFVQEFDINKIYDYDFMSQIYAYLFAKEYVKIPSSVIYFIELLQSKFPDLPKRKILEVASGYIPSLAILINELFDLDNTITCMDPKAFSLPVNNIVTIKGQFSETTDITNYDLLLGHCPCDAFDDIVKAIIKTPREMSVQTCPCRKVSFFSQREFEYYMGKCLDDLSILEENGYKVELDYTKSFDFTLAPVVTLTRTRSK